MSVTSISTHPAALRRHADRLLGLCADELTLLVAETVAHQADWEHLVRLPEPGADRWWTRLESHRTVDLWLLTWLPGHATDLHDHGTSAAAFSVVSGGLAEIRVDHAGVTTRQHWRAGSVTWLAPGVVHEVTGAGAGPAVSIHAYSPPLTQMNYYDPDLGSGLRVVRTVPTDEPEETLW